MKHKTRIKIGIHATFFLTVFWLFSCQATTDASQYLTWNAKANEESCSDGPSAVWADFHSGAECIRYFASSYDDLDSAPFVFIRFYGDRTDSMKKRPNEIAANTEEAQFEIAQRRADQIGIPVIIIARPGTYGSSGNHRLRRQRSEFLALNAAIDEIKKRHTPGRLILSGHSGGATAVAALLTFGRTDIACAIMTSGAFDLLERAARRRELRGNPPRPNLDSTGLPSPYDPLHHIGGIARDPDRAIVVIGNRHDTITPFDLQMKFAGGLTEAGHRVALMEKPAEGPSYHNLKGGIGYKAIEYCGIESLSVSQ